MVTGLDFSSSKLYFSIVIPTDNRPLELGGCLTSLATLDYPCHCFEVIVVDDGSQISLKEMIAQFYQSLNLTLVTQSNAGPATARNTGAKAASGLVLAFIDDDCQPTTHWLSILEHYFFNNQISERPCAVGGKVYNSLLNNNYSTASQSIIDYLYQCYNTNPKNCTFFTSNNLAVRTTDFYKIGGFEETFPLAAAEDREFCDRWISKGYQLIFVSNAVVNHGHELTLKSFWRQQFNYGRGVFHFHQKRYQKKDKLNFRQTFDQPWKFLFYINLLLYLFTQHRLPRSSVIAFLFLISQFAICAKLLVERSR